MDDLPWLDRLLLFALDVWDWLTRGRDPPRMD